MMGFDCEICQGPIESTKGDFDYTQLAGLNPETHRVTLHGIEVLRCKCGTAPVIANVDGLHYAIGLALIESEGPLTGRAIRFLRKTLGKTQREFAEMIDLSPEYLSDWECDRQLPKRSARGFAAIQYISSLLELEDMANTISMERIGEVIKTLKQRVQDHPSPSRIMVEPSDLVLPAWQIAHLDGDDDLTGAQC